MGKDSFAIHTSYEELTNIPSPFIAHVITNVDLFLFITKVTAESIQTIDEKGKIESISRKDFEDMWDGNILIMDNRPGKISIPLKMKFSTIIKQIKYPMLILCVAILFCIFTYFKARRRHSFLSISYRRFRRTDCIHTFVCRPNRQVQCTH